MTMEMITSFRDFIRVLQKCVNPGRIRRDFRAFGAKRGGQTMFQPRPETESHSSGQSGLALQGRS